MTRFGRKKSGINGVSLEFESLESRRLLAIDGFVRYDAVEFGPDVRVERDQGVYIGELDTYGHVSDEAIATDPEDLVAYTGRNLTLHGQRELASATTQALSEILTPITQGSIVPLTTQVAAQLTTARVISGGIAEANIWEARTNLYGGFEFVPEEEEQELDYIFTGFIHFVGFGAGQASGDYARWHHSAKMGISITINGLEVAQIWARHSDGTSSPEPSGSTGDWLIGGFTTSAESPSTRIAINPNEDHSGGVNLLITFTSPIAPGDRVVFNSLVDVDDTGPFHPGISAGNANEDNHDFEYTLASSSTNAATGQYNFAQAINAWGFADEDLSTPPPPLVQTLPLPGNISGDSVDFDGDGDADEDDVLRAIEDTAKWASGDESLMREWTQAIIDWSQGDSILVTTPDDELSDYSFGDLSLREAIALANNNVTHPGTDTIKFAPWIKTIELDGTALGISSDIIIAGPGAGRLTIDGGGLSRLFGISSGATVTMSGLTLTDGLSTSGGGAIYNMGSLTLDAVDFIGNSTNNGGGAIFVHAGGTLDVNNSTFDDNHATDVGTSYGGAIAGHFSAGQSLTIRNSTFSDNSAATGGAVMLQANGTSLVAAAARIENSTFSGNTAASGGAITVGRFTGTLTDIQILNTTLSYNTATAGVAGGIYKNAGDIDITIHNSIVAKNTASNTTYHDVYGSLAGTGGSSHNIIGQIGNSGLSDSSNGNKVGTITVFKDPLLAPLGHYGGRTKTHALLVGSIALESGDDLLAPALDQRGGARPVAVSGVSDIGAFEAGDFTVLRVTSDGDRNDALNLRATIDSLRLREAVALATYLAGNETIEFDKSLYQDGPAEILLSYDGADIGSTPDSIDLNGEFTISGPGADKLAVSGGDVTRPFTVYGVGEIAGITIRDGAADSGGGVLVKQDGSLTIDRVRVIENEATFGGGIATEDSADLLVRNSEIADNDAVVGGGVYFIGAIEWASSLKIINSTVSGNSATSAGGGLYVSRPDDEHATDILLLNATIAFNTAGTVGGGIYSAEDAEENTGYVNAYNTIISDNRGFENAADDLSGYLGSISHHNLIGYGDYGDLLDGVDGNIIGHQSYLTPLIFFGGTTRVHAYFYRLDWPSETSPAFDAGSNLAALDLVYDQRGFERFDENIDIGAYEFNGLEYLYLN